MHCLEDIEDPRSETWIRIPSFPEPFLEIQEQGGLNSLARLRGLLDSMDARTMKVLQDTKNKYIEMVF
jgi:hypothetical protein